jgi:peptidoglycan/xylan/chitin deacetylase (PgdA/CDA1 family)
MQQFLISSRSKIMFKHTIPFFLPLIIPSLTWKVQTNDKVVFLTFDDGPHPDITPWVLGELSRFNARATFFCVGRNVVQYPETYRQVLAGGHAVGNHTFDHLSGWSHSQNAYFSNIDACARVVSSKLFRPPYGRIVPWQISSIRQKGYEIIMWDILTRDYDAGVDIGQSVKATVQNTKPGSVIVFHDSVKAANQLRQLLPQVLQQLSAKGYHFKSLDQ